MLLTATPGSWSLSAIYTVPRCHNTLKTVSSLWQLFPSSTENLFHTQHHFQHKKSVRNKLIKYSSIKGFGCSRREKRNWVKAILAAVKEMRALSSISFSLRCSFAPALYCSSSRPWNMLPGLLTFHAKKALEHWHIGSDSIWVWRMRRMKELLPRLIRCLTRQTRRNRGN